MFACGCCGIPAQSEPGKWCGPCQRYYPDRYRKMKYKRVPAEARNSNEYWYLHTRK